MWDNIRREIEKGNFKNARTLLNGAKDGLTCYDDTVAVLEASVCEELQDPEGMFNAIAKGLYHNPLNYELYYLLGRFYCGKNPNQAFLCFQNALYYCDSEEDCAVIQEEINHLRVACNITVHDTVIVIPSYNCCYLLQKNVESIRSTLPKGTYRIVAVDNASDDGAGEWLEQQKDIILIKNKENRGYPCACNQGVKATVGTKEENSDIFLLNNDIRLAPNSLFWLRMGLYKDERTGAVGGCANYAGNGQQVNITFSSPDEYLAYGAKINIPLKYPYEERVRLSGFAMLIKRSVWDETGGMDESFSPGYFEDDDLCMRIQQNGFRILVCKNSFLYHAGSQSFSCKEKVNDILLAHHQMFVEKYGFDIQKHASPDKILPARIPYSEKDEFNVLQVGCALAADLKFLRSRFLKAHMVGVEPNQELYQVASKTEAVFRSIAELAEVFKLPVFDVVVINSEVLTGLSGEERNLLIRLCRRNCKILTEQNPYADFPFDKIKLIIWDLDDTFWKGTLSEEIVTFSEQNIQFIKDSLDRGFIHSVSSKNNQEEVAAVLKRLDLDPLFVFNDINWDNKGAQISRKLACMGLRAENVLFIDDNVRNLEEAKYANEGILTALPDIIPYLISYVTALPVSDMEHKRLEQYRILEKKTDLQKKFHTKEEFLYDSEIKVVIGKDCLSELGRIEELVSRTNQLNFTKVRSSGEELLRMISNDWMDSGYVRVRDKYGDYGIVGFYCYNRQERKMEHFLFSCRILGMKVEQYVYAKLGYPEIKIAMPVACMLEKNQTVPWITETAKEEGRAKSANDSRARILLKGPCDMSTIESYLTGGKVTTEFNYVNSAGFVTAGQNHSMHIWESANCSKKEIDGILAEAPFLTQGDFETMIFQKVYHVICYSLLPDCHAGLYRNKRTGLYISFGSVNFDLTDERNTVGYIDGTIVNHGFPFNEEIIRNFSEKWEFVGTTAGEDIVRNLQHMYYCAPGNPRFVLLLGSETEYEGENAEFANHALRHKQINDMVKAFAQGKKRIRLINMTDFIKSQEDYEGCINHFSRRVYYDLATAVCTCINQLL